MQGLYARYVRIGYFEDRHPVRYGVVAAAGMVAVLWPMFWRMGGVIHESSAHALLSAVEYSVAFCTFRVLFSRTQRRRDRFARWAAKHPEPQPGQEPSSPSMAASTSPNDSTARAPRSLHGRARAAWVGWTLLVALGVSWFLGLFLSTATGIQGGSTAAAVQSIAAIVISLPTAVYLRLYWPPVRDWKSHS